MKQRLDKRLTELKTEFDSGQKMLANMEARQADLRNTLIRISGAIQVLEELLPEQQDNIQEIHASDKKEKQTAASG